MAEMLDIIKVAGSGILMVAPGVSGIHAGDLVIAAPPASFTIRRVTGVLTVLADSCEHQFLLECSGGSFTEVGNAWCQNKHFEAASDES